MDAIYSLYEDKIVDPFIRRLKEEGEKCLVSTIELTSRTAKELVTSTSELKGKTQPMDVETVQYLIAMYGNLVAAEEALKELIVRVKELRGE